MHKRARQLAIVVTALPACVFSHAYGQATFRGLGDLSGGPVSSTATAVSADGRVVVGGSAVLAGIIPLSAAFASDGRGTYPLYDGSAMGITASATAVNQDGTLIVGWADYGALSPLGVQSYVWRPPGAGTLIGDLPHGVSVIPRMQARAISGNGAFVTGNGRSNRGDEAFYYNVATGVSTVLGDLPGGMYGSYAYGISHNGRTVVGTSYGWPGQMAFRWTAEELMSGLGYLPMPETAQPFSAAEAVSADGMVIVGELQHQRSTGCEAFRWTAAGGMTALGDLPGGSFQSWAYGVSGDGSLVVGRGTAQGLCGQYGCGSTPHAFVWDAAHGMRDLQQMLVSDYHLTLTGWTLTEARGVSFDGRTIVGNGFNALGNPEAWIITLPAPCGADLDNGSGSGSPDGGVTIDDLIYFLQRFSQSDLHADLDDGSGTGHKDGGVTIEDLLYFLAHYAAGC